VSERRDLRKMSDGSITLTPSECADFLRWANHKSVQLHAPSISIDCAGLAHVVCSHLIGGARALTHPRAFATHRLSSTHCLTAPHSALHYFRVHYEARAPALGRGFYSQRRLSPPNRVMFTPISTRRRQPERGAKS